jgi:uncharacterized membrane protein YdjX (TVP38/TMEM64 family)
VRKWALPVVLALLVVVAFAVGSEVRERLGFSFSLAGLAALREWVGGLGWYGPAVFVGLVGGALGLVASALLQFLAARVLGEDWVRPRLGDRHAALEDRVRRLGPAPVWAITAHPAGPQTPVNLAAGLVGLPIWEFALAVTLAAPLRAGAYAVLGTGILSWGLAASIGVGLGLVVLLFVPLMIPTVRSWALGTQVGAGARSADAPGGERGRDVRVDRELRSRQHGG